MSILGTIFGSREVIAGAVKLIDDMHTSDTEVIEAKTAARVKLLEAYEPFKVTQRYLALLFSWVFILSFVLVLGMTIAGSVDIDRVRAVLGEFYIGTITVMIIGFYFGGGFAEGIIKNRRIK